MRNPCYIDAIAATVLVLKNTDRVKWKSVGMWEKLRAPDFSARSLQVQKAVSARCSHRPALNR